MTTRPIRFAISAIALLIGVSIGQSGNDRPLDIESGLTSPANLVVVTDYKMLPVKGSDYNRLLSGLLPISRNAV